MSTKSASMTWHSKWTLHLEKFSENALWASSSRNRRERGVESEDEEAPKWRGFRVGVDLCLDVIDTTNVNKKRGREEKDNQKSPKKSNISSILKKEYVCIGNAWTCDMQNKLHHGLSPIQTYQHTNRFHTSKCMRILLQCICNAMYEVLSSFKHNPTQNCNNNSSILENPKIFQKPQNLGFKTWNAWRLRD